MAFQAIVELVPDTSKVESAIDQLVKKGAVSDSAASAYTKGNTELQKRNDLLATTEKNTNKVTEAQKKQIPTIQAIEKATAAMVDEFMIGVGEGISEAAAEAGVSVADLTKRLQEALSPTEKITNKFAGFKLAAMDTGKVVSGVLVNSMSQYSAVLISNKKTTEDNEKAQNSLKAQLREMRAEIALLLSAEDKWSDADKKRYDELIAKAGQLNDAIGDANEAVARSGSDTRGLDNLIDTTQGVAAGFAIVQGATALFGSESEELQKTLVKLNAVMAISQGLQQIQDLLSKKYIQNLLQINIAQKVNNAQLVIENGLQSKSIIVRTGATVAQYALNAAMAANPIGLIITALAAVIVLFEKYTSTITETAKQQAALNEVVESGTAGLNAELEVYDKNLKKRIADIDAAGGKQSEKDKAELQALRLKAEATRVQLAETERIIAANTSDDVDRKAALELQAKLTKDLQDLNTEGYVKQKALIKDVRDETKKAADDAKAKAKEAEDLAKKAREDAQKVLQAQANDRKALAEVTLLYVQQGTKEELAARIELINKTRDTELANAELTQNQRALLYAKANQDIIALQKAFDNQQVKVAAEVEVIKAQNRVLAFKEGTQEYYAAQGEALTKQAELETIAVQQSTDSEEKKSESIKAINLKLASDLEAIRKTSFEKEINQRQAAIERLQTIEIGRLSRAAQDVTKTEQQRFEAAQQQRMEELAALESQEVKINNLALAGVLSTEEYEKQKTDIVEAENQKRFEIEQAYAQREIDMKKFIRDKSLELASTAISTIADMEKQDRDAALQANLDYLNQRREDIMDNANLTESQKRSLNKKLDAEERKLKNDAARKERDAEIKKAIALGIIAAIQSYANFGFPYGLIAAGFSVAATTLQVAALQSTPIPQYAKGTKTGAKKGWALVGEEGPELVKLNGGEKILTARQTILAGATGDPDAVLANRLPGNHAKTLSEYSVTAGGNMEIDYDRLGKAVAKYMPQPSMHMGFDKDGAHMYFQEKNRRTEIRNKDYSL